jgi:kinetochore protein NDC80
MEIARLETELAHARAAAKAGGVGVAARLKSLQIAYVTFSYVNMCCNKVFPSYQEQIEKTDRLKEETVRAIVRVTSDMCNMKEQISEYLNHLRQVAEEN